CAAAARRLAGPAGERRVDVVHCHQGLSAYGVARAGLGACTVCTFHAPWSEEFAEDARARRAALPVPLRPLYGAAVRLKSARIHRMEGYCLSRCRAVAVLSEFSRERLAAAHGLAREGVDVRPAGVETEQFTPVAEGERERLRERLGFRGPTLLSVRRLVRRTGLDVLIRALPEIRSRVPDARLVLVGKGPERRRLEALAERLGAAGAVTFAGFVPDEALPDYYRGADLFVLPTRSLEGYGVATLEALASGTPVVGTMEGATPEILEPLERGLLVRSADPSALAAAVVRWLAAPRELAGLRPRCRRHVERNYSWPEAGRTLAAFYRRVLAG
ncbi:MAG: glycosyltransferase family 4 protein, partial [Nitrospinota bacterium]